MKALAIATLLASTMSLTNTSHAAMDPYLENALVSICKEAQSDNVLSMRRTIKGYRMSETNVAQNLVCNGEPVIEFAENNGAYKTASHLQKRVADSEIIDLAGVYSVTFE
ncbi:DUF3718 domain-containing protein [Thalassotalea maritima]|uniref:DUF3718 domain-containing protein n=1 Tax=Thalassotalea maritima TaxID=3242416 RepID=UPI0035281450